MMSEPDYIADDPRMQEWVDPYECQWAGCEEMAEPSDTLCAECQKVARIETDE